MTYMKVMLDEHGRMPSRAHVTDAGLDLVTPKDLTIKPYERKKIMTGVHVQLPPNTVGFIKSRSGMMAKLGITTDGTIDEGYTGEIGVVLFNNSGEHVGIKKLSKIAQLVVVPVVYAHPVEVKELDKSSRGDNGFGSTGQ